MNLIDYPILATLILLVLAPSLGQLSAVNQLSAQPISVENGPTFVCNLMDGRATAVGIGGADLGVCGHHGASI
jgi:hypothetical protein